MVKTTVDIFMELPFLITICRYCVCFPKYNHSWNAARPIRLHNYPFPYSLTVPDLICALLHAAALLTPSCSKWSTRDFWEEQCVWRGRICFWNEVAEAPGLTRNRCGLQSFVVGFSLTPQSASPSCLHQWCLIWKQSKRRLKTRCDYQAINVNLCIRASCLFCLLCFWPN